MPWAAPKHCPYGHPAYTGKRCPACRTASEARRPSARQRGYDSRWDRESKAFLALPANRMCACRCGKPANVVDHKIPHKGDRRLFWDRSNWQPMHRDCNSRKAASNEGGFGNPIRTRGDAIF